MSQTQENFDVQITEDFTYIELPDEVVEPNAELFCESGALSLTHEDADELRHLLHEASLNRRGLQPLSIAASQVEPGDIIPSLGLVIKRNVVVEGGSVASLRFSPNYTGEKINLPAGLEITVHRRIV